MVLRYRLLSGRLVSTILLELDHQLLRFEILRRQREIELGRRQ